jgi:hypothetical protein
MKNRNLLIYRIATGMLSVLMLFSAGMYFLQNAMVQETFLGLGFPTFIIYPLAVAKLLGLLVIWTSSSKVLKEWAYAGFSFNLLLAFSAHINANDGEFAGALMGIVLLVISYLFKGKLEKPQAS